MQIYSVLGSASTAISFVLFIGVVAWAWSKRRNEAFEQAAREPFALPDDVCTAPAPSAVRGNDGLLVRTELRHE